MLTLDLSGFPDAHNPDSYWYLVAAVTLAGINKGTIIGDLWHQIEEVYPLEQDRIRVLKRLREGILQGIMINGFPKTIITTNTLHTCTKEISQKLLSIPYRKWKPMPPEQIAQGKKNFDFIYGSRAGKVYDKIYEAYPDLALVVIKAGYAEVGVAQVIDKPSSQLLKFIACASINCVDQAKGHYIGTRRRGITAESVVACVEMMRSIAQQTGTQLELDKLDWIKSSL